jgi:translocator protein
MMMMMMRSSKNASSWRSTTRMLLVVVTTTTMLLWLEQAIPPCQARLLFGVESSSSSSSSSSSFFAAASSASSLPGGLAATTRSSWSSILVRGGGNVVDKKKKKTPPPPPKAVVNNNKYKPTTKTVGKKSASPCAADSNAVVATKMAASVVLQTLGLLAALKLAEVAPREFFPKDFALPTMAGGLPLLQCLASVFVIFSSSTVKSWLQGGGMIGAATSQVLKPNVVPGDKDWYSALKKPWFNPPGWVFPVMWLLVSKPTQLVALGRILKASNSGSSNNLYYYWPQLAVYCAHLSLGDAWNDVFFTCQRIGLGAYVIAIFFAVLLTSTSLFYNVDAVAGMFLLPTCAWVAVATLLNVRIYQLNKPPPPPKQSSSKK